MKFKSSTLITAGFVLMFISSGVLAQNSAAKVEVDIASLAWFAGCWEFSVTEQKMTISEMWTRPAAGTLIGAGRTIVNGKTVGYEYLRIAETKTGIDYIAKPSSASAETPFQLKSFSTNEVIFENLKNDFPQRIIYKRVGDDKLYAWIEGSSDGKVRSMEFPYARVECK